MCKIFVFSRLIEKYIGMMKKIMKMLLSSLLVCVTGMMVGCSINEEEVNLRPRVEDSVIIQGLQQQPPR